MKNRILRRHWKQQSPLRERALLRESLHRVKAGGLRRAIEIEKSGIGRRSVIFADPGLSFVIYSAFS